jgi:hypothetical protein
VPALAPERVPEPVQAPEQVPGPVRVPDSATALWVNCCRCRTPQRMPEPKPGGRHTRCAFYAT